MPAKGQTGFKHSPETIQKIKDAVRAAYDRGVIPWNKGTKNDPRCKGFTQGHTEETKKRISDNRKGKGLGNNHGFKNGHSPFNKGKKHPVHNEEWRKKVSESNSGSKHWNWKGGVTAENYRRRNTAQYKEWTKSVLKRDRWTCQSCLIHGQRGEIIAHHIVPWSENESLRFEVSNGVTLCRACHCHLHKPRTGTGRHPSPQSV